MTENLFCRKSETLKAVSREKSKGFYAKICEKLRLNTIPQKFLLYTCVMLAITPVTMLFFAETSVISGLTNLIVLPLTELAMLLGFVTIITGGTVVFPLKFAGLCCTLTLEISLWLGKLKWSHLPLGEDYVRYGIILTVVMCAVVYAICRTRKHVAIFLSVSVLTFAVVDILHTERNKSTLKIAVLGDSKNVIFVIANGTTADVIDVTGASNGAFQVADYLKKSGIIHINTLALLNTNFARVSAYEQNLLLSSVSNPVLGMNAKIHGITKVFEQEASYCAFDDFTVAHENYTLTIKNDVIAVQTGKISVVAYSGENTITSDITVVYGKYIPHNITAGVAIILDETFVKNTGLNVYTGAENYEISVYSNGKVFIRRL
jgi:hypothetical protein